ncbi:MAG TPA: trypsin-like serine protease [Polyangiaceae bacterium]
MQLAKLEWLVVAVGCASACRLGPADDAPEVAARSSSAITAGASDQGDEAVVAIVDATGTTACSGTVVAPYIVLTAGHCTVPIVVEGGSVVFGASLGGPIASIPIARAVPHPQFDLATLTNDVGILVLASAAPVAPVPLGASVPAVGASVRIVGWGLTGEDAGDSGQKRQGTAVVTAVDAATFAVGPTPSQPCEGDSGGPALETANGVESLVGVTSHGDSACLSGATYTRVDVFVASFIAPTMAAFSPASAAPGATCLFPEQCSGGASACVAAADDPTLGYCTASCRENADCPAAMICVDIPDGGSQCRYPVPTPGAYGAACGSDADCAEGECTTTGVCALRCVAEAPTCPAGFACTNTADIDFFCIGSPPAVEGGACALAPAHRADDSPWLAVGALGLGVVRRRSRRASR